jgi:hypothetical protein
MTAPRLLESETRYAELLAKHKAMCEKEEILCLDPHNMVRTPPSMGDPLTPPPCAEELCGYGANAPGDRPLPTPSILAPPLPPRAHLLSPFSLS